MSSSNPLGWNEETIKNVIFFALPAVALLAWDFWPPRRLGSRPVLVLIVSLPTLFVLSLYLCSVLNRILLSQTLTHNVSFMVVWPLLGIPLAIAGFFVGILAPNGPRWRLILANILLLIVTFRSMVAPN